MPLIAGVSLKRREYIKYQLRLRGTSLAALGRELGVSSATMSQVSAGERTSQRIMMAIEERLQVSVDVTQSKCPSEDCPKGLAPLIGDG